MSDGRTVWWSKDAAWWRREWIVILGEEFGASGPVVIDWLSCEASHSGRVRTTDDAIAKGCFVEPFHVPAIVRRAIDIGALRDLGSSRAEYWLEIAEHPGRWRPKLTAALRRLIIRRDGYVCRLCGSPVAANDVDIDHVVPLSRGGEHAAGNLQVTHSRCNRQKGARVWRPM